jgi:hypothetical protein
MALALEATGNHKIIADSAEEAAARVQRDAPKALIVTEGS